MGRQIMGTRIAKIVSVITILSVVCMLLSSCGDKKMPAYVLEAGEDAGLVQVYDAYFELDGYSVKEVRQVRFENLVERTDSYRLINVLNYNFDAYSTNGNPSDYDLKQSSLDRMPFDKATLIKFLRKLGVFWTGDIKIQLSEFDSYIILEARHTDDNAVTDIKTGLFRNGKLVELPKESSLKSVNKVYRKK